MEEVVELEEETLALDAVLDTANTLAEQTRSVLNLERFTSFFTADMIFKIIFGIISVIMFYVVYRLIRRFVRTKVAVKMQPQNAVMLTKAVSYVFYIFIVMYVLSLFGISLTAIGGVAGVTGIAVGFAAQTSISNIISGVFVVSEKALRIGDYISVGGVEGTVDTIGLLSVMIHTMDNQMVRIPNSSIIDSNLINYSHFPTRRLTVSVPIDYDSDLQHALDVMQTVPALCPTVLAEPKPLIYYDSLGDAVTLKFCVWFKRENLFQTRNDVCMNIVRACAGQNILLPYRRYEVGREQEGGFARTVSGRGITVTVD